MLDFLMSDIEADLCQKPDFFQFLKYLFFKRCFQAVLFYRIRHRIENIRGIRKINVVLDWLSFLFTSCFISGRASIGRGLYLPHATGIVIGSGCVIGNNVTIYQNVTLGRRNNKKADYPMIGDDSILCCGAVILGNIRIGNSCVVAANSVALSDTPDNSVLVGIPGRIV